MKIKIVIYVMFIFFYSCKKDVFKETYYDNGKVKSRYLIKKDKLTYYKSYYDNGKVYKFFDEKMSDTLFVYSKKNMIIGKIILKKKGTMISVFHPKISNKFDINEYVEIINDTLKYGKNWVELRYHTKFPPVDDRKNMKFLKVIIKNYYKDKGYKLDTFGFNNKHYKNGIFEVGYGVNVYEKNIKFKDVNIKIIKDFYYVKKPDTLSLINERTSFSLDEMFFIKGGNGTD